MSIHGIPLSIVSDKATQFTYDFRKTFQCGLGTNFKVKTTFHPQMDGLAEQTIQTLEDILRECFLDFNNIWDDHIQLIEFSYNNSYHASIPMAPFENFIG